MWRFAVKDFRVPILLTTMTLIFCASGSLLWSASQNAVMLSLSKYLSTPTGSSEDLRLELSALFLNSSVFHNSMINEQIRERVLGLYLRNNSSEYINYHLSRTALETAQSLGETAGADTAVSAFKKVIAMSSGQVLLEAHLGLADFLLKNGDVAKFETEMGIVRSLLPIDGTETLTSSTSEPIVIYVDTNDIALQRPAHIVLVWQVPLDKVSSPDAYFLGCSLDEYGDLTILTWQDLLIVVGEVKSQLNDGAFERIVAPRKGTITQLPISLYGHNEEWSSLAAIVQDTSSRLQNFVLEVTGIPERISGLSSSEVSVTKNACTGYLVAGKYRSQADTRPLIGVRWLLSTARSWNDNVSSYAVSKPAETWTEFRKLFSPPENATMMQFWVINQNSRGALQADDLGLFPLPIPCFAIPELQC